MYTRTLTQLHSHHNVTQPSSFYWGDTSDTQSDTDNWAPLKATALLFSLTLGRSGISFALLGNNSQAYIFIVKPLVSFFPKIEKCRFFGVPFLLPRQHVFRARICKRYSLCRIVVPACQAT